MKFTNTDWVNGQIYWQIDDKVYWQVYWQVDGQVRDQVRDQMDDQVKNQIYPIQNKISQEIDK